MDECLKAISTAIVTATIAIATAIVQNDIVIRSKVNATSIAKRTFTMPS